MTGCIVGCRTLKCLDYGKFVATFTDMETGRKIKVYTNKKNLIRIEGLFENIAKLTKEGNMPKIMEEKKIYN